MEKDTLEILNSYFKDDPNWAVKHHLDSYNDFVRNKIPLLFKNKNKASVIVYDKDDRNIEYQFDVYIGGKKGTKYKICSPVLHDYETGTNKPLYPNDARLRNLTYGFDIFYDGEIEVSMRNRKTRKTIIDKHSLTGEWLNNNYLGQIPIMVNSDMCILNKLPKKAYTMIGEAPEDVGGYFILDGAEKVIMTQERKAENMIYTIPMNDTTYSMNTIVKSKSDESFDLARDNSLYLDHDGYITVCIGPRDKPLIQRTADRRFIPLCVIFRILGVETDKEIVEMILGEDYNSIEKVKLLNLLRPSITDPTIRKYNIYDQQMAELFLEPLVTRSKVNISDSSNLNEFKKNKERRLAFLYDTIYESILPHMGRNFRNKAMFFGLMVRKLLMTHIGLLQPTNRDSFMNKRFDVSGVLIAGLFSRAFQRGIVYNATRGIRTLFEFATNDFMGENIVNLINDENVNKVFSAEAFKKYFNNDLKIGKIGYKAGVLQQMERYTANYYNMISQLRRVVLPTYGTRVTNERRHIQTNQFGYICCNESPEGGKIGLTLSLALLATVTIGYPTQQLRELCVKLGLLELHTISIAESNKLCRVMINGNWSGCILSPAVFVEQFKLMRRNGMLNTMTSISWYVEENEIYIYCDDGRLTRPLYIYENNEIVLRQSDINEIKEGKMMFNQLLTSRMKIKMEGVEPFSQLNYHIQKPNIYGLNYDLNDDKLWETLKQMSASVEYVDIKEMDNSLLTVNFEINPTEQYNYSHADFHPIIVLGYMGLYGVILNHGSGGKYLASGATKHPRQSVALYSTAFPYRFDNSAYLSHNVERPAVQNRFHQVIKNDIHGTGNNVIIAISYHNGFNQEDSFIFNKTSIDMGLFNSSYYKTYQSTEKTDEKTGTSERFYNPMYSDEVAEYPEELAGNRGRYTFEHLDKFGMVKEGTYLKGDEVLIGKYVKVKDSAGKVSYSDLSTHTKPDNKFSVVDKVFTCKTNAAGDELCKVRTCQLRIPQFGDKFASRNGQKGTIGIMLNREDMPTSASGIIPDIIMHPTSYPKRMTLNQLFEILYGKLASKLGFIGEANTVEPFDISQINRIMEEQGFEYGGDEYLYDGLSGKMMPAKIFIGPLYVQRLKLMVNDKINYRLAGKRRDGIPIPGSGYTTLDRSVVEGRAAGGGLKIGEMERDALIGQGIASVLYDRDMIRGDKFSVYVSPINGQICVGNDYDNIYYDDMADGPASYHLSEGSGEVKQKILGMNNYHQKANKFYKVNIPYSTKLLIHELQGAGYNIKLRPEVRKVMVDANKLSADIDEKENFEKDDNIDNEQEETLKPTIKLDINRNDLVVETNDPEPLKEMPQSIKDEFVESVGESKDADRSEFLRGLELPSFEKPPTYEDVESDPETYFEPVLPTTEEAKSDDIHKINNEDIKKIEIPDELLNSQADELLSSQEPEEEIDNSGIESESNEEIAGGSAVADFMNLPGIPPQSNELDTSNELDNIIEPETVKKISVSNWSF